MSGHPHLELNGRLELIGPSIKKFVAGGGVVVAVTRGEDATFDSLSMVVKAARGTGRVEANGLGDATETHTWGGGREGGDEHTGPGRAGATRGVGVGVGGRGSAAVRGGV